MYSEALQGIKPELTTNVRFFDFPNMIGQLSSFIHRYKNQHRFLRNENYVCKIMSDRFFQIENFLFSDYFKNLTIHLKERHWLSHYHLETSFNRIFIKQMTDLMRDVQIYFEKIVSQLPYKKNEYVVQTELKRFQEAYEIITREYAVYSDIDTMFIKSMFELLFYCKYEENFLQYIVIGSGDKDYSEMCRMARDMGILVITICFLGEGMSKNMFDNSDIVIILYPKMCIIKPFRQRIEEILK